MGKSTLRLISKIALAFAILSFTVDIATAIAIYLINPSYFYSRETNVALRDFLVERTPEATLLFIREGLLPNVVVTVVAALLLYSILWLKTSLSRVDVLIVIVAVCVLIYGGCKSLYGVSGNIRSIIYLQNGGV